MTTPNKFAWLTPIFADLYPRLLACALRITRNREDAEDAVSVARVNTIRTMIRNAKALLFLATEQAAWRLVQQRRKSPQLDESFANNLPARSEAEESAELPPLEDMLAALTGQANRDIVRLKCEGMTYEEIGEAVQKEAGACRTRFHRAVRKLKTALAPATADL